MPLIKCPRCGKPVSDRAQKCPHCGLEVEHHIAQQRHEDAQKKENGLSANVVICALAGLAILISAVTFFTRTSSEQAAEAIDTACVIEEAVAPTPTPAPPDEAVARDICLYGNALSDGKEFPITVTFRQQGDVCTNCVYKNVTYGTKVNMSGTKSGNSYYFVGYLSGQEVAIRIYPDGENHWSGSFSVDNKSIDLVMWM